LYWRARQDFERADLIGIRIPIEGVEGDLIAEGA